MAKINILTGNFHVPTCTIKYSGDSSNTHVSQILAGYKLLDNKKIIQIQKAIPYERFKNDGHYEHNSIVEVDFGNRLIAYDMADGYQSIHLKEQFDKKLDRLDFYFKRSLDNDFHKDMKNKNKIRSLSLNYLCTCKNNFYDSFKLQKYSMKEFIRFAHHIRGKKANTFDYKIFESNNFKYDDYNLLFLTRLWDSSSINANSIMNWYPYFSLKEATAEAEKWKCSLDFATTSRLKYIKMLKENFGSKIIAGVNDCDFSRKMCPEFIIDSQITNRRNYINMIKKNYVCITSEGLHHSIGWKFAEYVAAGKAIVSEPLFYEVPYGFSEDINYLTYSNVDSCIKNCELLLNNVEKIHEMEKLNREYYSEHLRPDKLVLDSLKIVFRQI